MIRRKAAEEKVVFSIKIHEVVLKKVERALERDPISVTLERGKHTVHTPDKDVRIAANGDATIIFNESLQFDATMTQEKGQYAEKSGKLILRRKKKGMMGSSFQEIGHVPLLFHLLLNDGLPQTKSMLLEKCTYPGSQVKITIDCQYAEKDGGLARSTSFRPGPMDVSTHSNQTTTTTHSAQHGDIKAPVLDDHGRRGTGSLTDMAPPPPVPHRRGSGEASRSDSLPGIPPPAPPIGTPDVFKNTVPFDADPFAGGGQFEDTTAFVDGWPSPSPSPIPKHPPRASPDGKMVGVSRQLDRVFEAASARTSPPTKPVALTAAESNMHLDSGDLQQQLDFAKSVVVLQEQKIVEAAAYIQYQEQQLAAAAGHDQMEQVIMIQEHKLEQALAELEECRGQLQQAKEYIDFQTDEITKLQSSSGTGHGQGNKELQDKLAQAADYINYQAKQLEEVESVMDGLRNDLAAAQAAQGKDDHSVASVGSNGGKDLQRELKAITAQRDRLEEFMNTQEEEFAVASKEKDIQIASLQKQVEAQAAELTELQTKLTQAAEYIAYGSGQVDKLLQEKAGLEESLTSKSAEISKLQKALEMANKHATDADKIQELMVSHQQELEKYKEQYMQQLQAARDEQETYVQLQRDDLQEMAGRIDLLTSSLHEKEQSLATATAELEHANQQIATLTSTVSGLQRAVAASGDSTTFAMTDLQNKLTQAAEYIAYQAEQISESEKAYDEAQAELSSLKEHLAAVEGEKNQTVERYEQQLAAHLAEHKTAMKGLADLHAAELKSVKGTMDQLISSHTEERELITSKSASALEQANQQIATLTNTVASLQAALSANGDSSGAAMEDMQTKLSQAAEYIAYQAEQISESEKASEAAKAELNSLKEHLAFVEGEMVDRHEHQLADLRAEHETSLKELAEMHALELKSVKSTLDQVISSHTEEKELITSKSASALEQANQQITTLTNTVASLQASLSASGDSSSAAIEDMQTKLSQAAEYIAYQTDQINTLQEASNEMEEEVSRLREQVQALEDERHQVVQHLEQQSAGLAEHETAVKAVVDQHAVALQTLVNKVDELTAKLLDKDKKLAEVTAQLESAGQQVATFTKTIEQLQAALESNDSTAAIAEMQEKLNQAAEYIAYQTDQVAGLEEANGSLNDALAQAKDSMTGMTTEIDRLTAAHAVSQKALLEVEAEWKNKLHITEDQLQTAEHQAEQLHAQVGQLTSTVHEKEQSFTKAEHDLNEANQHIAELSSTVATLQSTASSSGDSSSVAMTDLQSKLTQAAEFIAYQAEQLEANEQEATALRQQLHEMSNNREADQIEMEDMQVKLDQLMADNSKLAKAHLHAPSSPSPSTVDSEAYQTMARQVQQAKEYIAYMREQLAERDAVIAAHASVPSPTGSADLLAMQNKVVQAKEYIDYLQAQLVEKDQLLADMQQQLAELAELRQQAEQYQRTLAAVTSSRDEAGAQAAECAEVKAALAVAEKALGKARNDLAQVQAKQMKLSSTLTAAASKLTTLPGIVITASAEPDEQWFDTLHQQVSYAMTALKTAVLTAQASAQEAEAARLVFAEDNDKLVRDLIECKIENANVQNEIDIVNKKMHDLTQGNSHIGGGGGGGGLTRRASAGSIGGDAPPAAPAEPAKGRLGFRMSLTPKK